MALLELDDLRQLFRMLCKQLPWISEEHLHFRFHLRVPVLNLIVNFQMEIPLEQLSCVCKVSVQCFIARDG